eukprot:Clim_evm16s244 gene=Clim_evmTU16s244
MTSNAASGTNQVNFLRETVSRLTKELAAYQEKHPPLTAAEQPAQEGGDSVASWWEDADQVNPLFRQYDMRIADLERRVKHTQDDNISLRANLEQVASENDRLHSEVKQQVEAMVQKAEGGGGSGLAEGVNDLLKLSRDEWNDAQERAKLLKDEVKILEQQLRTAQNEADKAHADLAQKQREADSARAEVKRMGETLKISRGAKELGSDERNRYMDRITSLETMNRRLDAALKRARADTTAARMHAASSQPEQEIQPDTVVDVGSAAERKQIQEQRLMLQQLRAELEERQQDIELARVDMQDSRRALELAQTRVAEYEEKEEAGLAHIRQAMDMVDEARLQRDKAQARESGLEHEIATIKKRLIYETEHLRRQMKERVDDIQAQAEVKLRAAVEELKTVDTECQSLRAQLDRARRDQDFSERELERVLKEIPEENARSQRTVADLHARIRRLERERDEVRQKLDAAELEQRRVRSDADGERRQALTTVEEVTMRLNSAEVDRERTQKQCAKLGREIEDLSRQQREAMALKDADVRRLQHELVMQRKAGEVERAKLQARLDGTELSHAEAMDELQALLRSQQKISARYQEEANANSLRFENAAREMRRKVTQMEAGFDDLYEKLSKSSGREALLNKKLQNYRRTIKTLKQLYHESEARAMEAHVHASSVGPGDGDVVDRLFTSGLDDTDELVAVFDRDIPAATTVA